MCYTLTSCRSGFAFLFASLVMLGAATTQPGDSPAIKLPYDKSCPIIKTADGHEVPMFKDDPEGRALVATKVDSRIATEEWWRALKAPTAWSA